LRQVVLDGFHAQHLTSAYLAVPAVDARSRYRWLASPSRTLRLNSSDFPRGTVSGFHP